MASSLHDTWRYDKRSRRLFEERNSLRGSTTWVLLKTLEKFTLMVDTVLGRNAEDGRVGGRRKEDIGTSYVRCQVQGPAL